MNGRGGEIWTPDILLPKQARYRTALHPEQNSKIESISNTLKLTFFQLLVLHLIIFGAERGTRTPTTSRSSDFESDVSTNFTTSAEWLHYIHTHNWVPALTDSSTRNPGSTIGARGLNFCVRDGNRCGSPAKSTGTQLWVYHFSEISVLSRFFVRVSFGWSWVKSSLPAN